MSTQQMLVVFLLVIAVISFASLYFDSAKKMRDLQFQVEQLKSSQVLLMVPDDQAADIAAWLTKHPDKTKALAQKAANGEQITLTLGPGVSSNTNEVSPPMLETVNDTVIENTQGVKVIPLPHGGIRVTTRETDLPQNNQ
ncbi:membrane anchored protein in chemotaxis locus [Shewanella donghaensis]|uniref:membrane anchored protein in chemotaxis locus n=1 Tax=Shewanella donghaensis TaxID=238836 RepID=UPI001D0395F3|nr:membrane anchored protein in chemotaxis locus [Shewanella donghaensis]